MTASNKYQEGDVILCKVTNIVKTSVFVETEEGIKGSIVFSEIAPGRIRNIREYVVPKKIIACKVLKIEGNHLFLSLRRVKTDERKQLMEQHKKEKSIQSILKKITEGKQKEIIKEIKKQYESLSEFFDKARENSKILEKYFNKSQITQLSKVLKEKEIKEKEIKKQFKLSCENPDGIIKIKEILIKYPDITYLGNSQFQIKLKSTDLKKASHEIQEALENIEKQAKKNKCEFKVKK